MKPIQLYDTYTRSLREFTPLNPPEVGLYTCGPTVYDFAHIGNLRTYLFEDILRRALEFNGLRAWAKPPGNWPRFTPTSLKRTWGA
jgi:cysteinyl-tRNA synthetase